MMQVKAKMIMVSSTKKREHVAQHSVLVLVHRVTLQQPDDVLSTNAHRA